MAVGDIAQVAIRYRLYGQQLVNVQHFRQNTAITGLDELLGIFTAGGTTSIIDNLLDQLNNQTRITDLRAIYVRGGSPNEATAVIDRLGVTSASNPIPSSICVLISCRTALIGRRNRGRMYLPGPSGVQIDSGTGLWFVSYRALVQGFINDWQLKFTLPSPWTHVIWSPTENAEFGSGYIPPVVTDMLIDPVPRHQRRRAIELGAF